MACCGVVWRGAARRGVVCGGVVSWCGGVASLRLKDASLDQQRCRLFPFLAIKHCNQVYEPDLVKNKGTGGVSNDLYDFEVSVRYPIL